MKARSALALLLLGLALPAVHAAPASRAAGLRMPVLLFTAADDDVVPPAEVEALAAALRTAGVEAELVRTARGDHYDAMLEEGIPTGVAWLEALDAKAPRAR